MARQDFTGEDPLRYSLKLVHWTSVDIDMIRQLVARSEATIVASRVQLRRVERLEAEYFGRKPEQGR